MIEETSAIIEIEQRFHHTDTDTYTIRIGGKHRSDSLIDYLLTLIHKHMAISTPNQELAATFLMIHCGQLGMLSLSPSCLS